MLWANGFPKYSPGENFKCHLTKESPKLHLINDSAQHGCWLSWCTLLGAIMSWPRKGWVWLMTLSSVTLGRGPGAAAQGSA